MKGKLIAFASVLCVASLMASGANAVKPDKPPGKPDTPGRTKTELITFTGELTGEQDVKGCCLNAGPWPEYRLTLNTPLSFSDGSFYPIDAYDGRVFMSHSSVGKDRTYLVQFWTEEGENHFCIQINGGEIVNDKKNEILTVTFTNEEWSVMHELEPDVYPLGVVSFKIVRTPN